MSAPKKLCPNCGDNQLKDNNGMDRTQRNHGAHMGVHGLAGGHPVMATIGLLTATVALLIPKKLTCTGCGHTFKV